MIENHIIQEVLRSVDIVQLVGDYVQLKRMGRNIKGLCPFHAEKTPSFSVSPDKGMYYCFGCGAGGSAVDFLMRMEGLNFLEALQRLAERVGIELKHVDGGRELTHRRVRDVQREIMREASDFFVRELGAAQGAAARQYAQRRGISEEMMEVFSLGYASADWEGLPKQLRLRGQDLESALNLGLVGKREKGGYYGRFHERLMFAVRDEQGHVIAFSGRALEAGDTAKYINSPESDLYTKGQHLFGLYQAKEHIRREKSMILVEGNLDAVMMHGYGFRHTVASLGTALTSEQAKLVSRFCDKLILMYDGDKAGQKATMRALGVLLAYPIETRVVQLPDGTDPDSFVRIYGREAMVALIDDAQPLAMWCVKRQCESILAAPLELRKHSLGELGALLKLFTDTLAQRHFLDESARILSMDPGRLAGELSIAYSTNALGQSKAGARPLPRPRRDPVEWSLLRILLEHPDKLVDFVQSDGMDLLEDADVTNLLQAVHSLSGALSAHETLEQLEDKHLKSLYNECMCSDVLVGDELLEDWYRGAVARLTQRWVGREIVRVGNALQLSVVQNNEEETASLLERYGALQKLRIDASAERCMNWDSLERGPTAV